MIPESSEIKKRLKPEQTIHFVLYPQNYFEMAEEFTRLSTLFVKESFFEKISLWIEMVISPVISLCISLYSNTPPSFFAMLGFQKCFHLWQDWFEFRRLAIVIREWTNIVRSVGGPFISTNDPKYHVYVYADGMQRIHNSLLGRRSLTKEGTKRVE
jgi:hypothetical protein